MILRTYRINSKEPGRKKREFLRGMYWEVLKKDPIWHFFLDPTGGTLRFDPVYERRVLWYLRKNGHINKIYWKKRTLYNPIKDEYFGVAYLGDDLLPLFNHLSVLSLKYPLETLVNVVLERMNHGFSNMWGLHDFFLESKIYLNLAENRARLGGTSLGLPRFAFKIYLWFLSRLPKLKK